MMVFSVSWCTKFVNRKAVFCYDGVVFGVVTLKIAFNKILGAGVLFLVPLYLIGATAFGQAPSIKPTLSEQAKPPSVQPAQKAPKEKKTYGNRFFQRAMASYGKREEQKNHWKAVRHLSKMARKFPEEKFLQMWCARTALYCALRIEHGDTRMSVATQGETCAARVVEKNPGDYEAAILLIRNRLVYKKADGIIAMFFYADDAKDWLEPMVDNFPKRYEAYQVLGSLYIDAVREPFSFGDAAKGIEILEKGQPLAGSDAEYYYTLGLAYEAADRQPEARVSFKRCVDEGTARPELEWEATFFKELAKEKIK